MAAPRPLAPWIGTFQHISKDHNPQPLVQVQFAPSATRFGCFQNGENLLIVGDVAKRPKQFFNQAALQGRMQLAEGVAPKAADDARTLIRLGKCR